MDEGVQTRRTMATGIILIAVAFGAGLLLGLMLSRSSREALQKKNVDLQTSAAAVSRDLQAATSRALLWQIADGVASVRMNLAEKNYGLARDGAAATRKVLDGATGLPAETRGELSALESLLAQVEGAADSVAPEAKTKADDAAKLLERLLASAPSAP